MIGFRVIARSLPCTCPFDQKVPLQNPTFPRPALLFSIFRHRFLVSFTNLQYRSYFLTLCNASRIPAFYFQISRGRYQGFSPLVSIEQCNISPLPYGNIPITLLTPQSPPSLASTFPFPPTPPPSLNSPQDVPYRNSGARLRRLTKLHEGYDLHTTPGDRL